MKISRIISAVLAALMLLAPMAALAESAYVTSRATIYAEPDTSSKSAALSAGTKLEVVDRQGGWAKVQKGGAVGYMDASKLASIVDQGGKAVYAKGDMRMYKSPSTSSGSKSVSSGTRCSLLATAGDWAYVKVGSTKGFVKADDLTATAPEAPAGNAPEASVKTVPGYAKRDGVKVYKSAATSAEVLATLSRNDVAAVSGVKGGWCQVVNASGVGYVRASDLAQAPVADAPTDAPTPTPEPSAEPPLKTVSGYAKRDGVKVYASYQTSSAVVATLSRNAEVAVSGVKGSWCQVVNGSSVGYVQASDLATAPVADAPVVTPTPEPTKAPAKTAPGYAVKDGAKVYKSFSTSSEVVATLSRNDRVEVSSVKGDWCQIVRGEEVSYMLKRDLSTEPVKDAVQPTSAYAKVNGAKVYRAFSTTSTVLAELPANYEVTVVATNGDWAQVKNGSAVGYMLLSELSSTKVDAAPTPTPTPPVQAVAYVKNEGAKVYEAPSASSSALSTLSVNDEVGVSDAKDGWAKVVSAGGNVGYMQTSDLSATKVEVTAVEAYVKDDGAKVYESPSASASVLTTLSLNAAVSVTGASGEWCRVQNGTSVGYMLASDLSKTPVEVQALKYGDTGEPVKKVQQRLKDLGFFAGTVGGNYMGITQSAVSAFQTAAKITANGVCDAQTLKAMFADDAPKNSASNSGSGEKPVSNAGYSNATPAKGTAVAKDWWTSDIQKIFARGVTATVTDVATGIAWREIRSGGTNHADVQPVTAADANSMKKACGSWSWTRRAIFVTIDGVNYAASMNCMPHGSGSIKNNNFDGHHCIHFTNSRTHGGNKVCSLHQSAIRKAMNASL